MNTGQTSLDPRGSTLAKKTLIPKIDQKISGKTKFTMQNSKILNHDSNKQDSTGKVSGSSKSTIPSARIPKPADKPSTLNEVPKKQNLNPVKQISYNRTKLSQSEKIKPASPRATAVGRTQEKSVPNVRKRAPVPLTKIDKATRISLSAKRPSDSPKSPPKREKIDPPPEKELTRKQSSDSIPKKVGTPKKNVEVVQETTPLRKKSVASNKKQSSLESMASRSSRNSKTMPVIPRPATPLRRPDLEKSRPNSRNSDKFENKPRPNSRNSTRSSVNSDVKSVTPVKKPSPEKVASNIQKKPKSMEKIEESAIPKRTQSGDKKLRSSDKLRSSTKKSSEKVQGMSQISLEKSRGTCEVVGEKLRGTSQISSEKTRGTSQVTSGKPRGISEVPAEKSRGTSQATPEKSRGVSEGPAEKSRVTSQTTPEKPRGTSEIAAEKPRPITPEKPRQISPRGATSQGSQRKPSMEKISETEQSRPYTTDLPQRKVNIEKPGIKIPNISMESVLEVAKPPRSPKTSICGKERTVTISQPDISFFTRKITKNISKDKISVKNLIASRIASSVTVNPSAESILSVKRVRQSNTAQALTFDFYKRYKYVAFIGQVDEDTSTLKTHVTLYQPPEKELLLYDAANCAAAQAYMKICGLDFTVAYKQNAEQMSPSGKVPFIRCGSCIISEFEPISSFITSKGEGGVNKDPEDATMKAFMAMVSRMLENAERYVCWYDDITLSEHTKPRNGARYPFPLNFILNLKKKSEERRYLSAQGNSYKSLEQILRDVDTCLKHLSQRLGNNKVFFGKKHTEIDALVYGHIYALTSIKLIGPARRLEQIVKNHPNLIAFAKNIDDHYKLKMLEADDLSDVYQRSKDVETPITSFREAGLVC